MSDTVRYSSFATSRPPGVAVAATGTVAAGGRSSSSTTGALYDLGVMALEERFPRPAVVGIVNVTPDSFSDGGEAFAPDAAVRRRRRPVAHGSAPRELRRESTKARPSPGSPSSEIP